MNTDLKNPHIKNELFEYFGNFSDDELKLIEKYELFKKRNPTVKDILISIKSKIQNLENDINKLEKSNTLLLDKIGIIIDFIDMKK